MNKIGSPDTPQETDLDIIARMRLFAGLPRAELGQICRISRVREVPKGQRLFDQGDDAACFYGVLRGWVKVFRVSPGGDQSVIGTFSVGETFAEAAMFLGGGYPANAETVEPCRLCVFDESVFKEQLAANQQLCWGMLGSLVRHLNRMTNDIEQLQTRNAKQRLATFLVGLCDSSAGRAEVRLPYDKGLLAGRLGMQPESLSRNLAALKPLGVTVRNATVTIDDVPRLLAFARS